jgi:ferredoxin
MFTNYTSSLPTTKPPSYRRLGEGARVRLDASACLSVRYPDTDCCLCASACPTSVLTAEHGTPELTGDCLGCGLCSTACPTSALQTDGFTSAPDISAGAGTIIVDCWRVPLNETERGTVRVPCLGGITCGWLLDLFNRGDERPIRLLDRGGCSTCPAGVGLAVAKATVAEVSELLTDSGVAAANLPKVITRHGRISLAPPIPSVAGAQAIGRRGFFRDFAGSAIRTIRETDELASTKLSFRQAIPPVERMRVVTALASIATHHDRKVPSRALPQASLSSCAAHGICAGVCPTGALHRTVDGIELRFLSALCIGCGNCVRACPERSIRIAPSGGEIAIKVLACWTEQECESCGRSFVGTGGDLCPNCTKETDVKRGMAALFAPSM